MKYFLEMKKRNKHTRDTSSEGGSSDDDYDDARGAKRMRNNARFTQNMARKSVHGHVPPKAEGNSDR